VLSVLVYAAVVAYAAAYKPGLADFIAIIGAVGAGILLFALVRRAEHLLPRALACLGAAYALALFAHGSAVDERAPLVAVALLLCGELAAWSTQEGRPPATPQAMTASRAVAVGALAFGGLAASAIVVSFAAAPAGRGLGWTLLGAAAAVGVLAVVARLAQRAR
jgi:hypothetical protein